MQSSGNPLITGTDSPQYSSTVYKILVARSKSRNYVHKNFTAVDVVSHPVSIQGCKYYDSLFV